MNNTFYGIPDNVDELFANGKMQYEIRDIEQSGDNIFAMYLFLDCVGVPDTMIEVDDGTQVILNNGKIRYVLIVMDLEIFIYMVMMLL